MWLYPSSSCIVSSISSIVLPSAVFFILMLTPWSLLTSYFSEICSDSSWFEFFFFSRIRFSFPFWSVLRVGDRNLKFSSNLWSSSLFCAPNCLNGKIIKYTSKANLQKLSIQKVKSNFQNIGANISDFKIFSFNYF